MEKMTQLRRLLEIWGSAQAHYRRYQEEIEQLRGLIGRMDAFLRTHEQDAPPLAQSHALGCAKRQLTLLRKSYLALAQEIRQNAQEVMALYKIMDSLVLLMHPNRIEVLRSRYQQQRSWENIAMRMNLSVRQAQRLEQQARTEMCALFDDALLDQTVFSFGLRRALGLAHHRQSADQFSDGAASED